MLTPLRPTLIAATRSPLVERPKPAAATLAMVWNGSQWKWAQWTGREWKAAPMVADPWNEARIRREWDAGQRSLPATVTGRCGRGNASSGTWLLLGHIIASLLGLALGYYIVCCLRPAEFTLPSWPTLFSGRVELPDASVPMQQKHWSAPIRTAGRADEHTHGAPHDLRQRRQKFGDQIIGPHMSIAGTTRSFLRQQFQRGTPIALQRPSSGG